MDLSWFFLNDLSSSPGVTAAWMWLTAIVRARLAGHALPAPRLIAAVTAARPARWRS